MHIRDILSLCTLLVGISSAVALPGIGDSLDTVTGGHGKLALAILAIVGVVASQVIRVYSVPAAPTGTAYVAAPKAQQKAPTP